MEFGPRQLSFLKKELHAIEVDETRQPTERVEAKRLRQQVESELTE